MSEPKPGEGLKLYPDDEAPTAKRELPTVPCPACRGVGFELTKVSGHPARGGQFSWQDCRLCGGAKMVTASVAAAWRA